MTALFCLRYPFTLRVCGRQRIDGCISLHNTHGTVTRMIARIPEPFTPRRIKRIWTGTLLGIAIGFLVALWVLREALMPFFVAMVLAYLLLPLVERLARRVRRPLAVLSILAVAGGLLALVLWLLVPWLLDQLGRLVDSVPVWRGAIEARVGPWLQNHPWIAQKLREGIEAFDPMVLERLASCVAVAGLTEPSWRGCQVSWARAFPRLDSRPRAASRHSLPRSKRLPPVWPAF